MSTAAIYLRQSKEKKDSVSIEAQQEKCSIICQLNGWDFIAYDDKGKSGKDLNRPAFKQMMKDIESGKVQHIVCYRLDRISRSMADFSNLIVNLEQYGVDFVSATENFDTATPLGRAMVNIIMTFAQLERETITERVIDNYYYRGNLGHWPGGTAPYGYRLIKVTDATGKKHSALEIDPEQAKWVRYMYEAYLEPGGNIAKILNHLNELKVKTNRNALWTSRVVADLLTKPVYTSNTAAVYDYYKMQDCNIVNELSDYDGSGSLNLYGKNTRNANRHKRCREAKEMYLVIMQHTPIIEPELWLAVQHKKATKLPNIPPRSGTSKNSYLTGLIVCGNCGYRVSISKSPGNYRTYMCSTKKNRGRSTCAAPNTPAKQLEATVIEDMINHFTEPALVQKVKDNYKKQSFVTPEQLQKKNELDLQLSQIDKEIDNLMQAISSGNPTLIKYANIHITELDNQRQAIFNEMQLLDLEQSQNDALQNAYQFLYSYLDNFLYINVCCLIKMNCCHKTTLLIVYNTNKFYCKQHKSKRTAIFRQQFFCKEFLVFS